MLSKANDLFNTKREVCISNSVGHFSWGVRAWAVKTSHPEVITNQAQWSRVQYYGWKHILQHWNDQANFTMLSFMYVTDTYQFSLYSLCSYIYNLKHNSPWDYITEDLLLEGFWGRGVYLRELGLILRGRGASSGILRYFLNKTPPIPTPPGNKASVGSVLEIVFRELI